MPPGMTINDLAASVLVLGDLPDKKQATSLAQQLANRDSLKSPEFEGINNEAGRDTRKSLHMEYGT